MMSRRKSSYIGEIHPDESDNEMKGEPMIRQKGCYQQSFRGSAMLSNDARPGRLKCRLL